MKHRPSFVPLVGATVALVLVAAACGSAASAPSSGRGPQTTTTTLPTTTTTTTTTTTVPPTTTTTTTESGTKFVTYTPFTAEGALDPTLHVEATATGTSCGAYGVAGDSSYRCFTTKVNGHGFVFDPCFAPSGATSGPVYCPINPTSPTVVEITLSSLPPAGHTAHPWAYQLADGQVCKQVDAASGGVPLSCTSTARHTSGPVVRCHPAQEGSPWWTTTCTTTATHTRPTLFRTYDIDVVWH